MNPLERVARTARTAILAGRVYASYKLPRLVDRARGADPDKRELSDVHERNAWMIYRNAVALRGLMIKLAQVIGTRSDVFPPEYVRVLSQCHDAVPPRPWHEISKVLEQELGGTADQVFASFERIPVASASLAQVHRAVLKSGETVAVKIQYADIDDVVRTDLANTTRLCAVYERLDPQPMELMPLLKEMQKHLAFELDFRREVQSGERIAELFKDDPAVRVPRVHHALSTGRVITMEFLGGLKPTDKAGLERAGIDPLDVVQELMRIYTTMILARGFFQADPHPGNIFVNPHRTSSGRIIPRFVLLDFGLSKELPDGFGYGLFNLMFSLMTTNEGAMVRAFTELGFETKNGDPSTLLLIAKAMNRRAQGGKFSGEFTDEVTEDLFNTIRENPVVKVPSDFVLVGRAFSLLSGIAHTLGGRANVLNAMAPGSADTGRQAG
ncbi:MAG: AarF/ABC1/UbiB kinase family protein [Alphaproteobacteria bacterium]|nr:AarF/ABC1/UbiB kinase family protein [Alphaproteobacteria bacterium]